MAKRLIRLHIDDSGPLGEGSERRIVRLRKASGDRMWLDDQNEANVPNRRRQRGLKKSAYSARQLQRLGRLEVGVGVSGRVRDPRAGHRESAPEHMVLKPPEPSVDRWIGLPSAGPEPPFGRLRRRLKRSNRWATGGQPQRRGLTAKLARS